MYVGWVECFDKYYLHIVLTQEWRFCYLIIFRNTPGRVIILCQCLKIKISSYTHNKKSNLTVLLQVMLPKREEKFSKITRNRRRILISMIQSNKLIRDTLLSRVYTELILSQVWFFSQPFVPGHWFCMRFYLILCNLITAECPHCPHWTAPMGPKFGPGGVRSGL